MTSLELLNKFSHCADLRFKNDFGAKLCSAVFLISSLKISENIYNSNFVLNGGYDITTIDKEI